MRRHDAGDSGQVDDPVRLICADSEDALAAFGDATFDAIISDPAHGLDRGTWDVPPSLTLLREIFRALKPGGRLAFVSDDRSYHRLASALEQAGLEIQGMCAWVFASGRPRTRTEPRPAFAPIVIARRAGPPLLDALDDSARIAWRDDRDRLNARRANSLHEANLGPSRHSSIARRSTPPTPKVAGRRAVRTGHLGRGEEAARWTERPNLRQ